MPCDNGDGRLRVEVAVVVVVAAEEDVLVADDAKEGRGAPEPLEEADDAVRWCGR